jgi:hypothetical protein
MNSTGMSTASGVYAVSVMFGPASDRGKLQLKYPYGFEVGCVDPSDKTPGQWMEGTVKSVSGSNANVEFPQCLSPLKPMQIRYCWRTDPCTFNKCPLYSSELNPVPPFIMDLE